MEFRAYTNKEDKSHRIGKASAYIYIIALLPRIAGTTADPYMHMYIL